ncbi:FGGY-family carbohydrate kinase [Labrys wisconsinensis]|uniref:L-xylulokinase n=1 Tax=Labrys wisconsinensis TaxID=425677 RepID=A0ABU0J4L1_9HYPH|nr:FGGY-family carbohydrate kinase [Labrys wisconsinensis]MDQ0468122.1 L-xylulokinase [Labrys wisconsinensis]
MESHILAIDAGGTAIKVALYDVEGREVAAAGQSLRPLTPAPGYNERDPDVMWDAICRSVGQVLQKSAVRPDRIAVIGLTGYGNGLLLTDAAGRPVRHAILSSDQRAAAIVAQWRDDNLEAGQFVLTNQRLFAGKTLSLLAWLAQHEPATLARAAHVLSCKDYIRYRLTGRFNLEVSDASSGGFLDHAGRSFTPGVLDHFGLGAHAHLFTPTIEPLALAGQLTAESAAAMGLARGTPVSAGYADGPAMLLALGIVDQSLLNVVAGTWGLNQLVTHSPVTDGSILGCTLGAREGEYILIDGGVTSASTFEWFVDMLRPAGAEAAPHDWYNGEIAKLERNEPPVYFLPYVNGRLDMPEARGSFVGLSAWHRLPHMARAVFEGVAMEHRQHVEKLLAGRPRPSAVRFAGGAARSRPWLEIFAATLDLPVELSTASELGALGAAIIAAVGAGLHPDLETAVARMTRVGSRIEPDAGHVQDMARRYAGFSFLRNRFDTMWAELQAHAVPPLPS